MTSLLSTRPVISFTNSQLLVKETLSDILRVDNEISAVKQIVISPKFMSSGSGQSGSDAEVLPVCSQVDYHVNYGLNGEYIPFEEPVEPVSIGLATIAIEYPNYPYTGSAIEPAVSVVYEGVTLVKGTDYRLSFANNTQPGTATVTITGLGNYTGTVSRTFTIERRRSIDVVINGKHYDAVDPNAELARYETEYGTVAVLNCYALPGEETKIYVFPANGYSIGKENITPALTGDDPVDLKTSRAYFLTMPATGTVTIEATFYLGATLANAVLALVAEATYTYTGVAISPACKVTLDGKELVAGTDYSLSYSNNVNVGEATITAMAKGSYTGSVSTSFIIGKAPLTVIADKQTRVYGECNPELTYQITGFVGNDNENSLTTKPFVETQATAESPVGDYPIVISGAEAKNYEFNYTGSTLTVAPCSLVEVKTAIAEGLTYTGLPMTPTVTMQRGTVKLVEGTDYTVTITDNTDAGTAHLTIEGQGNYTAKIDTSFVIGKAVLTAMADALTKVYGGENPELTATITGFVNNEDVSIIGAMPTVTTECQKASPVGEYAITVSGGEAQNYDFNYVNAMLTVTPRSIDEAVVTLVDSVAYTGQSVLPELSVLCGDTELTEGIDYTVTPANNTEPGMASLTIEGQGNYKGAIGKTFVIYLKPTVEVAINDADTKPVLDEKNKAVFMTDYGKVVVSDYYALPGSLVTLAVTPAEGWQLGDESVAVSESVEELVNLPTSYVGTYIVPANGEVSINVQFLDSKVVGISDWIADTLRFEVVDGQIVRVLGAAETAPVSVYDARGQQVAAEVVRSERELIVRLARQPQGLYIIKVNNNSFKVYRK